MAFESLSVGLKFHGKVEVRWITSIFGEVPASGALDICSSVYFLK
jgi:hypothetical protein